MSVRKMVLLSLLVAVAAVLQVTESFIPVPVPVPGLKLGLANAVTLLAIILFSLSDGVKVAVVRTLLGALFTGTVFGPSFAMSFGGALASALVMGAVYRFGFRRLGPIGISVTGALAHNVTQLALAAVLVQSGGVFVYLPYLLLGAIPTGCATGYLAAYARSKLLTVFSCQN